jgi:hypothetical protein
MRASPELRDTGLNYSDMLSGGASRPKRTTTTARSFILQRQNLLPYSMVRVVLPFSEESFPTQADRGRSLRRGALQAAYLDVSHGWSGNFKSIGPIIVSPLCLCIRAAGLAVHRVKPPVTEGLRKPGPQDYPQTRRTPKVVCLRQSQFHSSDV